MAATLDEEIKRKKAEAALLDNDGEDSTADDSSNDPDPDDTVDPDDSGKDTSFADRPIYAPPTKRSPSYVLVPVTSPAPADTSQPPLTIPTPTPESPTQPADIQTDSDTGTRYVEDQGQKIPHAELATPADEEAFKPGDVTLPKAIIQGAPQVQQPKRADLVDPDPDSLYLDEPPEVRRGALVGQTSDGRQMPVDMDPGVVRSSTGPDMDPGIARRGDDRDMDPGIVRKPPGTESVQAPPTATPKPRATEFGLTPDEYKALAMPSATTITAPGPDTSGADTSGQADYFRKRGDAPITDENDPRLTTVSVGNQKWSVHKEAAPYFQGFLQELADQDAPMRSDGGWNYRQKVGAKGLSEHSWAGAIDLNQDGRDQVSPEFHQWLQDHPGALQAAEQRWHIYGGERFSDLGHFEWGGTGGAPGQVAQAGSDQNYISGRATTFGCKDQGDPGVGAPKLGGLSTNNTDLIGAAVPQEALQRYVSAHPADWRKARVEVVTDDGRRLLVPIVDLGPRDTSDERGVVADFTQALTNLTGNTGEQNYKFRIIPNAGPDVMKNPQEFADEQAAIREGIDTGARFRTQAPAARSRATSWRQCQERKA